MNRSIMVAVVLALAPMAGVPALAANSWDGTYVYAQSLGKNLLAIAPCSSITSSPSRAATASSRQTATSPGDPLQGDGEWRQA